MSKKCIKLGLVLVMVMSFWGPGAVFGNSGSPPNGRTGAPGEQTCGACHSGGPAGGSVQISGLPAEYAVGTTYTVTVTVRNNGQSRWGFETTAVAENGDGAGAFTITDSANTQLADQPGVQRDYVKHTSAGTFAGTPDGPVSWNFDWTAPAAPAGAITLYAAGNAADNSSSPGGDSIYTASASMAAPAAATDTPTAPPATDTPTPPPATDTPTAPPGTDTPTAPPATPTPTATAGPGSPTATPLPATATPEPTIPSATPTPVPTAPPGDLSVTLQLSAVQFAPGDLFSLDANVENGTGTALSQVPFFVLLDVFGDYWFYPGWSHYEPATGAGVDFKKLELPAGAAVEPVIPEFTWPDAGSGSVSRLYFHAAFLNYEMTAIWGTSDSVEWGYGP